MIINSVEIRICLNANSERMFPVVTVLYTDTETGRKVATFQNGLDHLDSISAYHEGQLIVQTILNALRIIEQ